MYCIICHLYTSIWLSNDKEVILLIFSRILMVFQCSSFSGKRLETIDDSSCICGCILNLHPRKSFLVYDAVEHGRKIYPFTRVNWVNCSVSGEQASLCKNTTWNDFGENGSRFSKYFLNFSLMSLGCSAAAFTYLFTVFLTDSFSLLVAKVTNCIC